MREIEMKTWRKIIGIVLVVTLGCVQANANQTAPVASEKAEQESLLTFNGGELYFTSNITMEEANRLGAYLIRKKLFNGEPRVVRVSKSEGKYELRYVLSEKYVNNGFVIRGIRKVCRELSDDVFHDHPVEAHLCNDYLKTLRVVAAR